MTLIRAAFIVALIAIEPPPLSAQAPVPVGIWVSETVNGSALRGTLTITRDGSNWTARIQSAEVRFLTKGDSVRFAFPSELGYFRGALAKDSHSISGFWVQPKEAKPATRDDPGGLSQSFATPLTLRAATANRFTGEVVPLIDRYTLYLHMWRSPSGNIVGAFRNPELNHSGGSSTFRVTHVGDSLIFSTKADTTRPEVRRAAFLDSTNNQILIDWPAIGRHIVLAPRAEAQAITLFPRLPRGLKYSYRAPDMESDGLPSGRARDVGMDEARLATLVQRISDTVPTMPRAPLIHSILVARQGKLILEEYFAGYDRDQPHDTRSAGKTFASVMLGALMKEGNSVRPETTIASLLPDLAPFANPDPRKQRITLANLMTHTSGLACNDNDENSPGNEGTMQSQTAQSNWWKYILDLPVTHDPGTAWFYCSGGSNLVGAGVAAAAGSWLPAYWDHAIARPLQFGRYYYNLMPTGEGYTGGGVFMRPRDLLKIGQVYLDSGVYNGKRIVSKEWVRASTSTVVSFGSQGENVSGGADGYAWHINTIKFGGKSYKEYEANGNGGQLLMVLPELNLAVVFTAGNFGNGGIWGRYRDDLLPNMIIAAIR